MVQSSDDKLLPYVPAPHSGIFEELNIFGTPTGVATYRNKGQPMPGAPRGFAWRPLVAMSAAQLRDKAAQYRDMAADATALQVASSLLNLADRFDALAAQREREEGSDKLED